MGLPAINSLANMEFMLYGGTSGLNGTCPSYLNGYRGTSAMNNVMNPYLTQGMFPYQYGGGFNPTFQGNSIYDSFNPSYGQQPIQTKASQQSTTAFQGVTQEDMDKLADYYAKNNVLEEGFAGAAMGGLSWLAFEHLQSVFHPKNAWKGAKEAEAIFKNVPKEFAKTNSALLQEAQIAVQQAVRDTGKKGWWSKWLRRPLDKAAIEPLVEEMKAALRSGNVEQIAKATERLQAARGMDGRIAGTLTGRKTVAERLASKTEHIENGAKRLVQMNESVIKNKFGGLVKSAFKKDFFGFLAFETLFNIGKITTAFQKDSTTGMKQTGQSIGKSALGTAGWCVGRAAGTWLGAKAGAAIGTAICPGAGTAIGALIGFTVGSIGMWAGHELGEKIFGTDVADKVEAKNMTKTEEGQTQLLEFALQKAQEGKTDKQTNAVLNKVINTYA
ncbi:hypothetical protein IJ750_04755 [bacterium]|nr:hypothetical protein [bacterium]